MAHPIHLHHVCVRVSDLRAAEDFYGRLLGLEKLWEFTLAPEHAFTLFGLKGECHFVTYAFASGRLEIFSCPGSASAPVPGQHFCLTMPERDPVAAGLAHAGVSLREIVREGRRIIFITDPDGNLIELKQDEKAS